MVRSQRIGHRMRWKLAANTSRAIERVAWEGEFDPIEGVILRQPMPIEEKATASETHFVGTAVVEV